MEEQISSVFINKNGVLCELISEDDMPFTRFLTGVTQMRFPIKDIDGFDFPINDNTESIILV